jgi:hypothetical protein
MKYAGTMQVCIDNGEDPIRKNEADKHGQAPKAQEMVKEGGLTEQPTNSTRSRGPDARGRKGERAKRENETAPLDWAEHLAAAGLRWPALVAALRTFRCGRVGASALVVPSPLVDTHSENSVCGVCVCVGSLFLKWKMENVLVFRGRRNGAAQEVRRRCAGCWDGDTEGSSCFRCKRGK